MKSYLLLLFTIVLGGTLSAQVGINTTNPQADLDVNGKVRIQDLSGTGASLAGAKLLATEPDGTVVEVDSGDLEIDSGGNINITGGGGGSASTQFEIAVIDLNNASGNVNNLDLSLGGANSSVVMFILQNTSGDINLRGIQGGTNGRRIILVNDTGNTINFIWEANNNGNQLLRYTEDESTNANGGSMSLVYTTDLNISGAWLAYNLDKGQ